MNTKPTAQRSTLRRLLKIFVGLIVGAGVLLTIGFVIFVAYPNHTIPATEQVDEYVYLDQGWGTHSDDEARQTYYYTGQGASIPQGNARHPLRYDWFVHLEQPIGSDRFADPEHLRAYRFIVDPEPTAANPDQLPVGFARHFNPVVEDYVLDITCAACHTGQLHYANDGKRYAIRIDGGQAMHAFTDVSRGSFGTTLLASLTATYANPLKFDRFARKVLGERYPDSKSTLHAELGATLKALAEIGQDNPFRHLYPTQEGFGRTDALGRIANTVFGDHLVPSNYHVGSAPVSYPYVWNIWKFDWVQYNGSVAQPLARNIGEAMGVGAVVDLIDEYGAPIPREQRYSSSVRIPELVEIEHTLQRLQPPEWPAQIFGQVDQTLAAEGRQLFETHCQGCHGPHPADQLRQAAEAPGKRWEGLEWKIEVIPVEHIGTDPSAASGFVERRYDLTATGITNEEVRELLEPIQTRRLLRDVRYRLRSLIEMSDRSDTWVALGARVPEDSAAPQIDTSLFSEIADEIEHTVGIEIDLGSGEPPPDTRSCDEDCHLSWLLWDTRFGAPAIDDALQAIDIGSVSEGQGLNIIGLLIKNKYYRDYAIGFEQQQCLEGFGTLDLPQQIAGYKPRPLEGVWATPPFLHNGSVPSIYQMLLPPESRDRSFIVGQRDYDPKHLGYVTPPDGADGFVFDTSIAGNHNTGHAFVADPESWNAHRRDPKAHPLPPGVIGPLLTDAERYAVLEYLKIHRDQPGTPEQFQPPACSAVTTATR
ncbi:MAG: di-heme-cytochrome C peroxidase [Pseudomonadota bacterium]